MNHLKNFNELNEEYDSKKHQSFNMIRKANESPSIKKILHALSLLDDVVHFDFKNIKNTFKNREGYDKVSEIMGELSIAIQVLKNDIHSNDPNIQRELFSDIEKYEIDVDKILNYLEDNDVKKYLEIDKRGRKNIYEKYYNIIEFLEKYRLWIKWGKPSSAAGVVEPATELAPDYKFDRFGRIKGGTIKSEETPFNDNQL